MNQDIENIIKKIILSKEIDVINQENQSSDALSMSHGYNQALSQIPVSLIANEVLNVVMEKIMEVKYSSHNPTIDCVCKTCVICNKLLNNLK